MILEKEMQLMKNALAHFDKKNNVISKSGVDWHIDHSLRAIYAICNTLKQSDEKDYKPSFNFKKTLLFFIKKFPRGKAKAPKGIISKSAIVKEVIKDRIETTKILLQEIENLPKNSNFIHPIFGMLNLRESIKFLQIHTMHHIKIIRDIISSQP